MARKPAVAGAFYEGEASLLREQIDWCYTHPLGPGAAPSTEVGKRSLVGLVSPHAGYMYSGPIAAHGFAYMARDGKPSSVIILGPNHTGSGSGVSIMTSGKWLTPLGDVKVDEPLAEAIKESCDLIDVDSIAHLHEHSIEVQLPFLQDMFNGRFGIVPICMMLQDEETSEEVGRAIAEAAAEKDVVIIASTDFTHYLSQRSAVARDRKKMDKILVFDWRGLLQVVQDEEIITPRHGMCGPGPVAAMLCAAKALGAKKASLLKYATSGDTAGPMPEVVGYGSIAVLR